MYENIDVVAVLMHGTPEILALTVDLDEDFAHAKYLQGDPIAVSVSVHSQDRTSGTLAEPFCTTRSFLAWQVESRPVGSSD